MSTNNISFAKAAAAFHRLHTRNIHTDDGNESVFTLTKDANVTQAGADNSTAVTVTGTRGKITMKDTVAATTSWSFTVSNPHVTTDSKIFVTCQALSSSAGTALPVQCSVTAQSDGQFGLMVYNPTDATTDVAPVVHYFIVD